MVSIMQLIEQDVQMLLDVETNIDVQNAIGGIQLKGEFEALVKRLLESLVRDIPKFIEKGAGPIGFELGENNTIRIHEINTNNNNNKPNKENAFIEAELVNGIYNIVKGADLKFTDVNGEIKNWYEPFRFRLDDLGDFMKRLPDTTGDCTCDKCKRQRGEI